MYNPTNYKELITIQECRTFSLDDEIERAMQEMKKEINGKWDLNSLHMIERKLKRCVYTRLQELDKEYYYATMNVDMNGEGYERVEEIEKREEELNEIFERNFWYYHKEPNKYNKGA